MMHSGPGGYLFKFFLFATTVVTLGTQLYSMIILQNRAIATKDPCDDGDTDCQTVSDSDATVFSRYMASISLMFIICDNIYTQVISFNMINFVAMEGKGCVFKITCIFCALVILFQIFQAAYMAGASNLLITAQGTPEDAFMNFAGLLVVIELDDYVGSFFAKYLLCNDELCYTGKNSVAIT
jgi:hypothetical protein